MQEYYKFKYFPSFNANYYNFIYGDKHNLKYWFWYYVSNMGSICFTMKQMN